MNDKSIEVLEVKLSSIDEKLEGKLENIGSKLDTFINNMDNNYVKRLRYDSLEQRVKLLEKAIFTVIGTICMSVIGAIIALVVQ